MDTEQSLKLFVVLCRTFSTVSDAAKKDIKRYGLSLSAFSALELLYHKGPQSIQDIGKKVLLTSGSVTYLVDQLEKKAYAHRKTCETDRRVFYVEISERGRRLLDEIFPLHERCISELFATLSAAQMIDLTETLKQISKSIAEKGMD